VARIEEYESEHPSGKKKVGDDEHVERSHILILGPFHGQPAVVRIPFGKGVCGTACDEKATQLVPDVHLHPNHIACDSASASEIVVPVFDSAGCLVAVLDMDSPVVNGFDEVDQAALERVAALLGAGCDWVNAGLKVERLPTDDEAPMCAISKKSKPHARTTTTAH